MPWVHVGPEETSPLTLAQSVLTVNTLLLSFAAAFTPTELITEAAVTLEKDGTGWNRENRNGLRIARIAEDARLDQAARLAFGLRAPDERKGRRLRVVERLDVDELADRRLDPDRSARRALGRESRRR